MSPSNLDFARFVQDQDGITSRALAAHFGVSERTVRSYMQHANEEMEGFASISCRKGSYTLAVSDEARFCDWASQGGTRRESSIPSTQKERVAYLLNDLLERSDWITLDELSRVLFISKSRLSRCMGSVEETLARYDLSLEKRPRYGLRVVGSEINRRMCLASLAVAALNTQQAGVDAAVRKVVASAAQGTSLDQRELLETVTSCLNESVRETDFHVNSAAYQNLIVHIAVAVIRIKSNCYVPVDAAQLEQIRETREFSVAQIVARRVSEAFEIELPEEEVAYIAIHLASKQLLGGPDGQNGNLVISDEVWGVVSTIIDAVWNAFRFDFQNDLELRMNLARHIVPLSVRLRYKMSLKNPMVSDMRARYPLAYSMAIEAASVLSRHYETEISDDEVGYLAFAFALALERQKTGRPKKNVLVVCASGAGSARLLEYRCREMFGGEVARIETCDAMSLGSVDFSDIDYVFTTVPLATTLPVPVLEIQYFLEPGEVHEALGALRGSGAVAKSFEQIDQALILPHLSFSTKTEALDYLLDQAEQSFPVAANFRELVWKREAMMPTALGNRVAMPHPIEAACDETRICVGIFDAPIAWDGRGAEVRVAFLMAFAKGASTDLRDMLQALATVLFSPEAIDELIECQDLACLKRLIEAAQLEEGTG